MIGDKTAPDLPMLRDDEPATLPQLDGLRALLRLTEPVTYPPRLPAAVSPVSRRGSHRAQVPAQTHWRRLGTYGLIGAVVFLAGVGLQVGLVRLAGMSHLASYAIQTAVSIQLSYLLNRLITWRDRDVAPSSWLRFGFQQAIVQGLGVAGYAGLTRIGVEYVAANIAVTAVLAPAGYASSHLWSMTDRREWWRVFTRGPWPLMGVLTVQAALSLRLIWSNTAFTDEALYIWAGHLEWQHWLHGLNITSLGFPRYFSGAPVIYPPLVALFDSVGGLALARCLSLLFMLGATLLLWSVAKRLHDRTAAFYACALFVLAGTAQDIGAFADYDAMAIFFTALSFWLGVRGAYARRPAAQLALYSCAGLAFIFADAVKYASGLWNPIVLLGVAAVAWHRGQLKDGVIAATAVGISAVTGLGSALALAGPDYVRGILYTTVNRQLVGDPQSVQTVLWLGFTFVWILVLLSVIAAVLHIRSTPAERLFYLVLLAAVVAAPANQARIHTYASLYKHVVFGAWFGAIAAGWLIGRARTINTRKGWRIGAAIGFVALVAGYGQATTQFQSWPDTAPVVSELRAIVTPESGRVGFATINGFRWSSYYLGNKALPSQMIEIDGPVSSAQLTGGYYTYVDVDTWSPLPGITGVDQGQQGADRANADLEVRIRAAGDYRLIYTGRWKDAWYSGESRIWKYEGAAR
jgi:putative flippase GtrA